MNKSNVNESVAVHLTFWVLKPEGVKQGKSINDLPSNGSMELSDEDGEVLPNGADDQLMYEDSPEDPDSDLEPFTHIDGKWVKILQEHIPLQPSSIILTSLFPF